MLMRIVSSGSCWSFCDRGGDMRQMSMAGLRILSRYCTATVFYLKTVYLLFIATLNFPSQPCLFITCSSFFSSKSWCLELVFKQIENAHKSRRMETYLCLLACDFLICCSIFFKSVFVCDS